MDIIIKGILTGCILSIMIGPVFFVLLETSIRKGVRAALAFDLGVLLNDLLYIAVAFIFYNQVAELKEGDNSFFLRLIGGSLFTIYGVYYLLKKVKETCPEDILANNTRTKDYVFLLLKGFILNLANPLVIFYWFGVMTLGAEFSDRMDTNSGLFMFLGAILLTFFSIDFLKILGAKRLRPLVTHKRLLMLNRLIGIIFATSGIILIVQGILGIVK